MRVMVDVYNDSDEETEFLHENSINFLNFYKRVIDKTPKEYRDDLRMSFWVDDSSCAPLAEIKVFYFRDATKEEVAEKEKNYLQLKNNRIKFKRDMIEGLIKDIDAIEKEIA